MKSPEVPPERFESVLRESSVRQKRLTQAKQKCAALFPLVPITRDFLISGKVRWDHFLTSLTEVPEFRGPLVDPFVGRRRGFV